MKSKAIQLRQERAKLLKDQHALINKAEAENRDLTGSENEQYDRLTKEAVTLLKRAERQEQLASTQTETVPVHEPFHNRGAGKTKGAEKRAAIRLEKRKIDKARAVELRKFLVSAPSGTSIELGARERRDLQADNFTAGGATFQREKFMAELIQAVDDVCFVRKYATVIPIQTADSIGVPTLDTDPSDADWTSELATGSKDTAMGFGKRAMTVRALAKRILISEKLLEVSAIDVEKLVIQRLAYRFGISQEKAFMTGTGVQQPLGLFTAHASGIPTGQDVNSTSAAQLKADDFINLLYKLKSQYHPRASFVMHRDLVAASRKLKDGNGQYLLSPGLGVGAPDTILGRPILMSEYAPSAFTTGTYGIVVGDLSQYWIIESLAMRLKRLVELYAEAAQVGFIGRVEIDGAPVLAEAFARLKFS